MKIPYNSLNRFGNVLSGIHYEVKPVLTLSDHKNSGYAIVSAYSLRRSDQREITG